MAAVRHVVGEMVDLVQRCVICGEIIDDLRGAMWSGDGAPPSGWTPGAVYIQGKNPKVFTTTPPEDGDFMDCNNKEF